MRQSDELRMISQNLILFLLRKKLEERDVYEIFNDWTNESGIMINHEQNLQWCLTFIQDAKNNIQKNTNELKVLLGGGETHA